jgi:hypothetical protein
VLGEFHENLSSRFSLHVIQTIAGRSTYDSACISVGLDEHLSASKHFEEMSLRRTKHAFCDHRVFCL